MRGPGGVYSSLQLLLAAVLAPIALLAAGGALAGPAEMFAPVDANTSLLVVSPHPDDESLCCAGVIQRVRAAGGQVNIVWVTSGDDSVASMLIAERTLIPSRAKALDLARRRMREARAATSILGVPAGQQLFLGYPDGGILPLLTQDHSTPRPGGLTGESRVPYSDALFPGHPYTGDSLEQDFAAVLDRARPTLILAPSTADTHPDHRACGLLAMRVLARRGESAKARYWIVHGGEGWPSPRVYMPSVPLTVPLTGRKLPWSAFDLTDGELVRKRAALDAYRTQMQVMAPFLLSFVRTTELYSPAPTP
jgi:LmbE family N-acetylglucosaminyl deacetylase